MSVQFANAGATSQDVERTTHVLQAASGTVCFHIQITAYGDWLEPFVAHAAGNYYWGFEADNTGTLYAYRKNSQPNFAVLNLWTDGVTGSNPTGFAGWAFVALTSDGTTLTVYMQRDGGSWTVVGTIGAMNLVPASDHMAFGGTPIFDPDVVGTCNVREGRVWSSILTPTQLQAERISATPVVTTGLLSSLHFTSAATAGDDTSATNEDWAVLGTPTDNASEPTAMGGGGTNTPMTISANQTQTAARSRNVGRPRSVAETQTASIAKGRGYLKTLTGTIAQTSTRLRGVGRTRTATQTQTTSAGPSIVSGLGFTATQAQTPSRVRGLGTPKAATETQTATRLRLVAPVAKSATQTQTASVTKGQGYFKTLTATITQTVAIVRALGLIRSALETQTAVRAIALARALSAVQTQSKAITRTLGAGRAVTGTQTASLAKATNRLLTLSITATQTASRSRALGRSLSVTATQTLARVRALARALNVTNSATPSVQVVPSGGGPINYPMTIAATVNQTIALARACAKPLSALQSQSITRARALALLAKSATQAQAPSIVKGQGYFKALTANAVQTAARVLGLGVARSGTQSQTANAARGYAVTRTATVSQFAVRERAINVAKSANQTQTLSLVKGRGFFVTIAAVAIQVAAFVKSVGLTRFATQSHALDIQSEVAGGGFPILTPAAPKYCTRGRDLRSAVYTTKGRDLRS